MANKNEGRCLSCGEIFTADVRNRGRQRYCGKPGCRRASKAASQRRWLSEPQNHHYFRDAENAARVLRAPVHDGRDSGMMADSNPAA